MIKYIKYILIGLFIFSILIFLVAIMFVGGKHSQTKKTPEKELTQIQLDSINLQDSLNTIQKKIKDSVETTRKKIEAQFSVWDGSHRSLEKAIKNSLNNPASYEHVKTERLITGDSIIVLTTFRANNAFGGKIIKQAKGIYDFEGNQKSAEFIN